MSKNDYIAQIEHKIDAHRQTIDALQREIEKLEGAIDVIAQLRGNDGARMTIDVTPEKRSERITIAKITGQQPRRVPKEPMGTLVERVRTGMADMEPAQAVQIGRKVGLTKPEDLKRIWYVLGKLIDEGAAVKENGLFLLVRKQDTADVAA